MPAEGTNITTELKPRHSGGHWTGHKKVFSDRQTFGKTDWTEKLGVDGGFARAQERQTIETLLTHKQTKRQREKTIESECM